MDKKIFWLGFYTISLFLAGVLGYHYHAYRQEAAIKDFLIAAQRETAKFFADDSPHDKK